MKVLIDGININYFYTKKSENAVLLLHGWGGNILSFKGLEDYLINKNYSVINLDFPGFNQSDMPRSDFNVDSYAKIIIKLLKYLKVKKVSIVAHSFGGRVAIKLSAKTNLVSKLILVDSAGIKPKFSLKKYFKISIYKTKKWLNNKRITKFDLSKYGSSDYKNMPSELKCVFNNIVNEDLTKLLKYINIPTLLIWGEKDKDTPLYMAKKMNRLIKNSGLVIIKNAEHFSYLEQYSQFLLIINNFLS